MYSKLEVCLYTVVQKSPDSWGNKLTVERKEIFATPWILRVTRRRKRQKI